jgi:hypothetical protein
MCLTQLISCRVDSVCALEILAAAAKVNCLVLTTLQDLAIGSCYSSASSQHNKVASSTILTATFYNVREKELCDCVRNAYVSTDYALCQTTSAISHSPKERNAALQSN